MRRLTSCFAVAHVQHVKQAHMFAKLPSPPSTCSLWSRLPVHSAGQDRLVQAALKADTPSLGGVHAMQSLRSQLVKLILLTMSHYAWVPSDLLF